MAHARKFGDVTRADMHPRAWLGIAACSFTLPACGVTAAPADVGSLAMDAGIDAAPFDGALIDAARIDPALIDAAPIDAAVPLRVLFVGNSYTSYNDLPAVVVAIGAATGTPIEVDSVLRDGGSLWDHWTVTGAVARIENGDFDVVVLQGQSLEPIYQGFAFSTAAEGLAGVLNAAGSRGVWFATWPRRADHEFYSSPWGIGTPAQLNDRIEPYYRGGAYHTDDGFAARVGAAWLLAADELPEVTLYASDGSHPTPEGTLLAACVIYQGVTGRAPRVPDRAPLGISSETARDLCALAPRVECVPGSTVCDGSCVWLVNDPENCGACGVACPSNKNCTYGVCECPIGATECADTCVDLRTDPQNCGACGASCDASGMPCFDGACHCPTARRQTIGFAELSALRPACDSSSSPFGDCIAAAHEHCAAQDCFNSGFGPSFSPGFGLSVMCLAGDVRSTSYTALRALVPACDGTAERVGPSCATAISRYCASTGAVSGFGPVDNAGDDLTVTCLPDATVIHTTLDALAASPFPGCDGPDPGWGFDCTNAAGFVCVSMGYGGGFGPVEVTDTGVDIVCVDR